MSWSLYLDDLRDPKTKRDWVIVRSVEVAKQLVRAKGCPEYISFDHDLGEDVPTGYDFAKWLIDQELMEKLDFPSNFEYNVHSANPVGKINICGLLDGYLGYKQSMYEDD